ncbi:transposase, partial [Thiolapillus sp.]
NKPYWGNHFWAKGYCVDTVGVDAEMILKWLFSALMSEQNVQ